MADHDPTKSWREFIAAAKREGWIVVTKPDNDGYYGRTEVRRRDGRSTVYVYIETDTFGRIIRSGISYGAERVRSRSADRNSLQCALSWLSGIYANA